jgi:hypothetical protein
MSPNIVLLTNSDLYKKNNFVNSASTKNTTTFLTTHTITHKLFNFQTINRRQILYIFDFDSAVNMDVPDLVDLVRVVDFQNDFIYLMTVQ